MKKLLFLCLAVALSGYAQTVHNGNFQVLGSFDVSSGTFSKPMVSVATDPTGSCGNAAAMVVNTSIGAQKGDISICVNGTWTLASTGSSGSITLAGDVTATSSGGTFNTTVGHINGVALSSLTGIVKFSGSSPANAAFNDVVALFAGGSCTGLLKSDGSCLNFTLPLSVANGGTGTASPSLIAGANVTVSGSWPNQTISSTGGGGGSASTQFTPSYGGGGVTFGTCSSGAPCFLAPNGILDAYTATPAVTPSSGTAADTLWVYGTPGSNTMSVGYNSANTYGCAGCTLVNGISAIPANAYGLYSCTVTSGQVVASGCTTLSTPYSNSTIVGGLGVGATRSVTTGALSLNNNRTVRNVTAGSTDTIANTDCGGAVTYAVSSTMTVTLPQAGLAGNFLRGCDIWLINIGAGSVNFTPAGTSKFNNVTGAQTLSAASAGSPTSAYLISDASNYWGGIFGAGGGGGAVAPLTLASTTTPQLTISDPSNILSSIKIDSGGPWTLNANGTSAANTKLYFKNSSTGLNTLLLDPSNDAVTAVANLFMNGQFGIGTSGAIDAEGGIKEEMLGSSASANVLNLLMNQQASYTGALAQEYRTATTRFYNGVGGTSNAGGVNDSWYVSSGTSGIVLKIPDATGVVQLPLGLLRLNTQITPASSGATCVVGTIEADASFIYVCTATNTWKRATLAIF